MWPAALHEFDTPAVQDVGLNDDKHTISCVRHGRAKPAFALKN